VTDEPPARKASGLPQLEQAGTYPALAQALLALREPTEVDAIHFKNRFPVVTAKIAKRAEAIWETHLAQQCHSDFLWRENVRKLARDLAGLLLAVYHKDIQQALMTDAIMAGVLHELVKADLLGKLAADAAREYQRRLRCAGPEHAYSPPYPYDIARHAQALHGLTSADGTVSAAFAARFEQFLDLDYGGFGDGAQNRLHVLRSNPGNALAAWDRGEAARGLLSGSHRRARTARAVEAALAGVRALLAATPALSAGAMLAAEHILQTGPAAEQAAAVQTALHAAGEAAHTELRELARASALLAHAAGARALDSDLDAATAAIARLETLGALTAVLLHAGVALTVLGADALEAWYPGAAAAHGAPPPPFPPGVHSAALQLARSTQFAGGRPAEVWAVTPGALRGPLLARWRADGRPERAVQMPHSAARAHTLRQVRALNERIDAVNAVLPSRTAWPQPAPALPAPALDLAPVWAVFLARVQGQPHVPDSLCAPPHAPLSAPTGLGLRDLLLELDARVVLVLQAVLEPPGTWFSPPEQRAERTQLAERLMSADTGVMRDVRQAGMQAFAVWARACEAGAHDPLARAADARERVAVTQLYAMCVSAQGPGGLVYEAPQPHWLEVVSEHGKRARSAARGAQQRFAAAFDQLLDLDYPEAQFPAGALTGAEHDSWVQARAARRLLSTTHIRAHADAEMHAAHAGVAGLLTRKAHARALLQPAHAALQAVLALPALHALPANEAWAALGALGAAAQVEAALSAAVTALNARLEHHGAEYTAAALDDVEAATADVEELFFWQALLVEWGQTLLVAQALQDIPCPASPDALQAARAVAAARAGGGGAVPAQEAALQLAADALLFSARGDLPAVSARVPGLAGSTFDWVLRAAGGSDATRRRALSQRLLALSDRGRAREGWRAALHAPPPDLLLLHAPPPDLPQHAPPPDPLARAPPPALDLGCLEEQVYLQGLGGAAKCTLLDGARLGTPAPGAEEALHGASQAAGHALLLNTWHLLRQDARARAPPADKRAWAAQYGRLLRDLARALEAWRAGGPDAPAAAAVLAADLPMQLLAIARERWPGPEISLDAVLGLLDARASRAAAAVLAAAHQRAVQEHLRARPRTHCVPGDPESARWDPEAPTPCGLVRLASLGEQVAHAQLCWEWQRLAEIVPAGEVLCTPLWALAARAHKLPPPPRATLVQLVLARFGASAKTTERIAGAPPGPAAGLSAQLRAHLGVVARLRARMESRCRRLQTEPAHEEALLELAVLTDAHARVEEAAQHDAFNALVAHAVERVAAPDVTGALDALETSLRDIAGAALAPEAARRLDAFARFGALFAKECGAVLWMCPVPWDSAAGNAVLDLNATRVADAKADEALARCRAAASARSDGDAPPADTHADVGEALLRERAQRVLARLGMLLADEASGRMPVLSPGPLSSDAVLTGPDSLVRVLFDVTRTALAESVAAVDAEEGAEAADVPRMRERLQRLHALLHLGHGGLHDLLLDAFVFFSGAGAAHAGACLLPPPRALVLQARAAARPCGLQWVRYVPASVFDAAAPNASSHAEIANPLLKEALRARWDEVAAGRGWQQRTTQRQGLQVHNFTQAQWEQLAEPHVAHDSYVQLTPALCLVPWCDRAAREAVAGGLLAWMGLTGLCDVQDLAANGTAWNARVPVSWLTRTDARVLPGAWALLRTELRALPAAGHAPRAEDQRALLVQDLAAAALGNSTAPALSVYFKPVPPGPGVQQYAWPAPVLAEIEGPGSVSAELLIGSGLQHLRADPVVQLLCAGQIVSYEAQLPWYDLLLRWGALVSALRDESAGLGCNWVHRGEHPPREGTLLTNAALSRALEATVPGGDALEPEQVVTLSAAAWRALELPINLPLDSTLLARGAYFSVSLDVPEAAQARVLEHAAVVVDVIREASDTTGLLVQEVGSLLRALARSDGADGAEGARAAQRLTHTSRDVQVLMAFLLDRVLVRLPAEHPAQHALRLAHERRAAGAAELRQAAQTVPHGLRAPEMRGLMLCVEPEAPPLETFPLLPLIEQHRARHLAAAVQTGHANTLLRDMQLSARGQRARDCGGIVQLADSTIPRQARAREAAARAVLRMIRRLDRSGSSALTNWEFVQGIVDMLPQTIPFGSGLVECQNGRTLGFDGSMEPGYVLVLYSPHSAAQRAIVSENVLQVAAQLAQRAPRAAPELSAHTMGGAILHTAQRALALDKQRVAWLNGGVHTLNRIMTLCRLGLHEFFALTETKPWVFELAANLQSLEDSAEGKAFMFSVVQAKARAMLRTLTPQDEAVLKYEYCLRELRKPPEAQDASVVEGIVRMGRAQARLTYTTPDPRDVDVGCLSRGLLCPDTALAAPCAFAGTGGVLFESVHRDIVRGCDRGASAAQMGTVLRNIESLSNAQCLEVYVSVARVAVQAHARARALNWRTIAETMRWVVYSPEQRDADSPGVASSSGLMQLVGLLVAPEDKMHPFYKQLSSIIEDTLEQYVLSQIFTVPLREMVVRPQQAGTVAVADDTSDVEQETRKEIQRGVALCYNDVRSPAAALASSGDVEYYALSRIPTTRDAPGFEKHVLHWATQYVYCLLDYPAHSEDEKRRRRQENMLAQFHLMIANEHLFLYCIEQKIAGANSGRQGSSAHAAGALDAQSGSATAGYSETGNALAGYSPSGTIPATKAHFAQLVSLLRGHHSTRRFLKAEPLMRNGVFGEDFFRALQKLDWMLQAQQHCVKAAWENPHIAIGMGVTAYWLFGEHAHKYLLTRGSIALMVMLGHWWYDLPPYLLYISLLMLCYGKPLRAVWSWLRKNMRALNAPPASPTAISTQNATGPDSAAAALILPTAAALIPSTAADIPTTEAPAEPAAAPALPTAAPATVPPLPNVLHPEDISPAQISAVPPGATPASQDAVAINAPPVPQKPAPQPPVPHAKPAAPTEQPEPAAPTEHPKPAAPTEQPKPAAPTEQPKPAAPTEQPKPAAPCGSGVDMFPIATSLLVHIFSIQHVRKKRTERAIASSVHEVRARAGRVRAGACACVRRSAVCG